MSFESVLEIGLVRESAIILLVDIYLMTTSFPLMAFRTK